MPVNINQIGLLACILVKGYNTMTPLGLKLRQLREDKNVTLRQMAKALNVSPSYISALEHGWRSVPQQTFLHQICDFFSLWGDDSEEIFKLAKVSNPKVTVDTGGLSPNATELANILANEIVYLNEETITWIIHEIKAQKKISKSYMPPPSLSKFSR